LQKIKHIEIKELLTMNDKSDILKKYAKERGL